MGGGYGAGYGAGGGPGGPGTGPGGPGEGVALKVYPEKVVKGGTITLVADPGELAKGMPAVAKAGSKSAYGSSKPGANPQYDAIEAVEFYRDRDGDGKLNPLSDELVGEDTDGSDEYSTEVDTSEIPLGQQQFFAMPKGAEGTGNGRL